MKRRDFAFVFAGLAVSGSAAASSDTQNISLNLSGASAITVTTDISLSITPGGTNNSVTYSSDSASFQINYEAVAGNSTGTISVSQFDAPAPPGTELTLAPGAPTGANCGNAGTTVPMFGIGSQQLYSGIGSATGCNASLTYTWDVTNQASLVVGTWSDTVTFTFSSN